MYSILCITEPIHNSWAKKYICVFKPMQALLYVFCVLEIKY